MIYDMIVSNSITIIKKLVLYIDMFNVYFCLKYNQTENEKILIFFWKS